jgi:hypothetical protein
MAAAFLCSLLYLVFKGQWLADSLLAIVEKVFEK